MPILSHQKLAKIGGSFPSELDPKSPLGKLIMFSNVSLMVLKKAETNDVSTFSFHCYQLEE